MGKGENAVPTPADFSNQERSKDIFTLNTSDPLFHQKTFEQPSPPKRAPKPRVEPLGPPVGSDLPGSFYEATSESYLKARRVAELKFNTLKLAVAFACISASLVAIDVLLYPEIWWSQWPIGMWAFVIAFPLIKSFVFRGQDLRSVIERRLHKMALREVERFDGDL